MKEDREFGPFGSVIISDHLEILAEFQGKVFHSMTGQLWQFLCIMVSPLV
jgi:hypothetical protein